MSDRSKRTSELFCRAGRVRSPRRRLQILNEVAEVNLPVADALASRYARRGVPEQDLTQVARAALVTATRRYRPEACGDFLGYAVPCIRGELRRHFRDCGWMVRPPRRVQEAEYRIMAVRPELSRALDREPTPEEYADVLDLDVGTATEALTLAGCFQAESLDRPVQSAEPVRATLGDRLGEEEQGFAAGEARAMLEPLLAQLPDRDRKVVHLSYFEGLTQKEVGQRIGVTQMQVSRILKRIIAGFREDLGVVTVG